MIKGVHTMFYTSDAEGLRVFLRDKLGFKSTDVGDGWLIFGLPPSEVAFHPSEENNIHEFYLLCDDIKTFRIQMSEQNISCNEVKDEGWGLLFQLTLPGGGRISIYQPRHARPDPMKGNELKASAGKNI